MTANQINYQNLKETIRHNRTVEGETGRHNFATEGLTAREIAETTRHNVASEGLSAADIREKQRHNVQTENINWYSAQSLANLQSSQAALAASDIGVKRYGYEVQEQGNMLNYDLGMYNANISGRNADTAAKNATTVYNQYLLDKQRLAEQVRHNKQSESASFFNSTTNLVGSAFGSMMGSRAVNQALEPQPDYTVDPRRIEFNY